MATQIKNTLSFANLAPGTSVVIAHGLNNGQIAVVPDIVFVPSASLDVLVDATNVTLFNKGPSTLSGSLLVEWWHTIERAFGDAANLDLPVKPYVVVAAEGGNQPPIPPFEFIVITIYARLTGNDTTGDGTLANPYRTTQRAVRDVPPFIPPGVRYFIDNSGIGIETLPDDYELPAWKSSSTVFFDGADPYIGVRAGVTLYAEPELADPDPTRATITFADILAVTTNPTSNLVRVQLTPVAAAAKAWGVNEWQGKLFAGAGGSSESAVVDHNTVDTLFLTTNVSPTAPARILVNSAILEGQNTTPGFDTGAFVVNAIDSIAIIGQEIRPIVPGPFTPGLISTGCGGYGGPFLGFCTLSGPFIDDAIRQVIFTHCSIEGGLSDSQIIFVSCFVKDWDLFERNSNRQLAMFQTVYQAGATIEVLLSVPANGRAAGQLAITNCEIRDNLGDAIHWAGGDAILENVWIHDNVGDGALFQDGVGFARLINVRSTAGGELPAAPNGGIGCNVQNGNQVEADAATNDPVNGLRGTTNDQKVGNIASGAWPGVAFNTPDYAGATATGSRLYQL